jgi:hypothetical protein
VLLIMVFWLLTRSHVVAHSLIQAILVIAYFPVVKTPVERNGEHRILRRLDWNDGSGSRRTASNKGVLAIVYTVRSILCTGGLLLLMLRVEMKRKAHRTSAVE